MKSSKALAVPVKTKIVRARVGKNTKRIQWKMELRLHLAKDASLGDDNLECPFLCKESKAILRQFRNCKIQLSGGRNESTKYANLIRKLQRRMQPICRIRGHMETKRNRIRVDFTGLLGSKKFFFHVERALLFDKKTFSRDGSEKLSSCLKKDWHDVLCRQVANQLEYHLPKTKRPERILPIIKLLALELLLASSYNYHTMVLDSDIQEFATESLFEENELFLFSSLVFDSEFKLHFHPAWDGTSFDHVSDECFMAALEAGGMSSVFDMLQKRPNHANTLIAALRYFAARNANELCLDPSANRIDNNVTKRIIITALVAIRKHPKDMLVQDEGCWALCNVGCLIPLSGLEVLAKLGGFATIMTLVKKLHNSISIQRVYLRLIIHAFHQCKRTQSPDKFALLEQRTLALEACLILFQRDSCTEGDYLLGLEAACSITMSAVNESRTEFSAHDDFESLCDSIAPFAVKAMKLHCDNKKIVMFCSILFSYMVQLKGELLTSQLKQLDVIETMCLALLNNFEDENVLYLGCGSLCAFINSEPDEWGKCSSFICEMMTKHQNVERLQEIALACLASSEVHFRVSEFGLFWETFNEAMTVYQHNTILQANGCWFLSTQLQREDFKALYKTHILQIASLLGMAMDGHENASLDCSACKALACILADEHGREENTAAVAFIEAGDAEAVCSAMQRSMTIVDMASAGLIILNIAVKTGWLPTYKATTFVWVTLSAMYQQIHSYQILNTGIQLLCLVTQKRDCDEVFDALLQYERDAVGVMIKAYNTFPSKEGILKNGCSVMFRIWRYRKSKEPKEDINDID